MFPDILTVCNKRQSKQLFQNERVTNDYLSHFSHQEGASDVHVLSTTQQVRGLYYFYFNISLRGVRRGSSKIHGLTEP
jgi:hypothetical protein